MSSSSTRITKPSQSENPPQPRCQHVSRNGRACRYLGYSVTEPYCKYHIPDDSPVLHAQRMQAAGQAFIRPDGITNVLFLLYSSVLYDVIPDRKAGILTYIAQTILNAQRAELEFQKLDAEPQGARLPTWPTPPYSDSGSSGGNSPQTNSSTPSTPPSPQSPSNEASAAAVPESQPTASGVAASPAPTDATPAAPKTTPPPAPPDLNHFFPRDPTLPPNLQNPDTYSPPPPPAHELERRHARFNQHHGFRSVPVRRCYPQERDPDWKIINGR